MLKFQFQRRTSLSDEFSTFSDHFPPQTYCSFDSHGVRWTREQNAVACACSIMISRLTLAGTCACKCVHVSASRLAPAFLRWSPLFRTLSPFKTFMNRVLRLAPTLWLRFLRVFVCVFSFSSLLSFQPLPHSLLSPDVYYHSVQLFNYLCFVTYVIGFHLVQPLSASLFYTRILYIRRCTHPYTHIHI